MAWTALPTTIVAGATDHLDHHLALHPSWNAAHVQLVSTSQTLTSTQSVLIVNADTSGPTLTLPETSAAGIDGHFFVIKRAGANSVIVQRSGSDTFDDAATSKTLGSDLAAIGLMSIGDTVWYISGERGTVS